MLDLYSRYLSRMLGRSACNRGASHWAGPSQKPLPGMSHCRMACVCAVRVCAAVRTGRVSHMQGTCHEFELHKLRQYMRSKVRRLLPSLCPCAQLQPK